MKYEKENVIAVSKMNYGAVLFYAVAVAVGVYALNRGFRPAMRGAGTPPVLIIGGLAMVLISSCRHRLTTRQMITIFAFIPVRRVYPDDIRQITVLPPEKKYRPGLMFVENCCERFDREKTTATEFKKKHPIACVTLYASEENIERLINLVEPHWGPVEGKYLLKRREE